jgi:hypothetical protein
MLSLRESAQAAGILSARKLALQFNISPPFSLHTLIATQKASHEIEQFHSNNLGILTVGAPTGQLTRTGDGNFLQAYTFGTIVKPSDAEPFIASRILVDLRIAGVRCFGTDDPSGTDEPYFVTTVVAVDPSIKDNAVQTIKFGPGEIGPISPPVVFAQDHALTNGAFAVPGEGSFNIHVTLMDHESGDPEDVKNKASTAAQVGMAAGIAAIPLLGPPAAVLAKSTGILEFVGDAVGDFVAEIFGDDLIGQLTFVVDNGYLKKVLSDGETPTLTRRSDSIPGEAYNFPQLKEEDSPEGRSWLFDRGPGKGTYRMFFRIRLAPVHFTP